MDWGFDSLCRDQGNSMTNQEKALKKSRQLYGNTAFTEDTVNYRRVGYHNGTKVIVCIGTTWNEVFKKLEK